MAILNTSAQKNLPTILTVETTTRWQTHEQAKNSSKPNECKSSSTMTKKTSPSPPSKTKVKQEGHSRKKMLKKALMPWKANLPSCLVCNNISTPSPLWCPVKSAVAIPSIARCTSCMTRKCSRIITNCNPLNTSSQSEVAATTKT